MGPTGQDNAWPVFVFSGEVVAAATTYLYDGDGNPVKKTTSAGVTYYVGNYYERYVPYAGMPTITKYCYFNSLRSDASIHSAEIEWVSVLPHQLQ